MENILSV